MKNSETALPDSADLEKEIERILALIGPLFAVTAATTSGFKRVLPTAKNAPPSMTEPNTNQRNQEMNTLTPNRILQKGDEYRDNGSWKPVPKEEIGLQVMFSKLKKHELRRPSEAPPKKTFPAAPVLAE